MKTDAFAVTLEIAVCHDFIFVSQMGIETLKMDCHYTSVCVLATATPFYCAVGFVKWKICRMKYIPFHSVPVVYPGIFFREISTN
jgi:hypothetical protein